MALYVYQCKCGFEQDVSHPMSESPALHCPDCLQVMRKKITAPGAVHFKGTGFYTTDKG